MIRYNSVWCAPKSWSEYTRTQHTKSWSKYTTNMCYLEYNNTLWILLIIVPNGFKYSNHLNTAFTWIPDFLVSGFRMASIHRYQKYMVILVSVDPNHSKTGWKCPVFEWSTIQKPDHSTTWQVLTIRKPDWSCIWMVSVVFIIGLFEVSEILFDPFTLVPVQGPSCWDW